MKKSKKKIDKKKEKVPLFYKESKLKKWSAGIPIIGLFICFYLYFFENVPLYSESVFLYGVAPTFCIFGIVFVFIYSFIDADDLTDNKKAAKVFAPFFFVGILSYCNVSLSLSFFDTDEMFFGAIGSAITFTFIFLYSANFFQPDLDHPARRPGYSSFPFGSWLNNFKLGRSIKFIFKPVTKIWFIFWQPFAILVTHRGISHFPLVGTWIRVAYLYVPFFIIKSIVLIIYGKIPVISIVNSYFIMFFPWSKNFLSNHWIIICLPIFLSDIIHSLVDFVDSMKKGVAFCGSNNPRGLIIRILSDMKKILLKK